MIRQGIAAFSGKRILLLQGPAGPFFARMARDLRQAGAEVHKVNFNGGDWFYFWRGAHNYRGDAAHWPAYVAGLLDQLKIDVIILFGDCRPIHKVAHQLADQRGLEIAVFEEGYIRPDFITLEQFGVNGHSRIPRSAIFYLQEPCSPNISSRSVGNSFPISAWWTILYYVAAVLLWPVFRRYQHHRPLGWFEGLYWLRSFWRKAWYRVVEARSFGRMRPESFFLVPLQVNTDYQVRVHSEFGSVEQFIDRVMRSFAAQAPADASLVIKHHPLDRGYHDYAKLIHTTAHELGVSERCHYIHDQHLPTLLNQATGVVVVNSTVGFSALEHGAPVKVCGESIYDMPGMTAQTSLDNFWQTASSYLPDPILVQRFRDYVVAQTQLNGNFYKRLPFTPFATGLDWSVRPELSQKELTAQREAS